MKRFAICGNPVLHSKSPQIFNQLLAQLNIAGHYTRLAVNSAGQAISFFKHLELNGMNVTAPFKEEIIPFLDDIDEAARSIGAVNTVVASRDRLKGLNTDYMGVNGALEAYGAKVSGEHCTVIGAGGAARAAVYALQRAGGNVTVVNRTYAKADRLVRTMGCQVAEMANLSKVVESSKIIVSTMAPGVDLLDPQWLTAGQTVLDANYVGPSILDTDLQSGCQVIKGYHWLVHQAVPVFEHFTGQQVAADQIKSILDQGSEFNKEPKLLLLADFPMAGILARNLSLVMECPYTDLQKHQSNSSRLSAAAMNREGKGVLYLAFNQFTPDILKHINHAPEVIVVGLINICQGRKPELHSMDLIINDANGEEAAAQRIYNEYQHIQ